jgi:hypothetical protein
MKNTKLKKNYYINKNDIIIKTKTKLIQMERGGVLIDTLKFSVLEPEVT